MKKLLLFSTLLCLIFNINANGQELVNTATIDASKIKYRISRNIYGHFSEHLGHCIYEGFWVGENSKIPNVRGIRTDVVDAMKRIKAPALRWPGGCFADEYHWKDGIGGRSQRPTMINTNWGGVTEDNSFGTHEFLDLCEQIGCEPYISGNLGSGTVQELSQWVEYINSDNISPMTEMRKKNGREKAWKVKFWGLGNESWGCGGNMKPDYYSDEALKYGNFCRTYGNTFLNKIAVGPNSDDYNWTDVVMREMGTNIWGLSLHYYTWADGETAADFKEDRWFGMMYKTLKMEEFVTKHSAVMDKYDSGKSVSLVVDEWGAWYKVEPGTNPGFLYQQNTLRDALIAGINLNIFNNHCDRIRMAAVAQAVNVLQSVILTKDDKMVLTPTYHVFDMYKVHHDAMMVPVTLQTANYSFDNKSVPALNISSSIDKEGKMHISICNLNPNKDESLICNLNGFTAQLITGQVLSAEKLNAHNTFENPGNVVIKTFNGFKKSGKGIEVKMPAHSVVVLEVTGSFDVSKTSSEIKDLKQGLQYSYYEGSWQRVPDFSTLTPLKTGTINDLLIPAGISTTNMGIVYDGYLRIKTDGLYEFLLTSDDGSKLLIDNEEIASNDGLHAMIGRAGTIFLKKGDHPFKVAFFQGGGGYGIEIKMQGPGMDLQTIPADLLLYMTKK